jgi:hypothetical protein
MRRRYRGYLLESRIVLKRTGLCKRSHHTIPEYVEAVRLQPGVPLNKSHAEPVGKLLYRSCWIALTPFIAAIRCDLFRAVLREVLSGALIYEKYELTGPIWVSVVNISIIDTSDTV